MEKVINITRRDFLNGVAITIVAGMAPIDFLTAAPKGSQLAHQTLEYYPPALTGMRGSHEGSYEEAHHISRDGQSYDYTATALLDEDYDLIVVGAGISGLAAAYHYQQQLGPEVKILLLDNHDDFGGHARRNEFTTPDGMLIGYGGSESLQSPRSIYSKQVLSFMRTLGIDIDELENSFNINFYPDLGLGRGVYFDAKTFGVNKLVAGDPGSNVADEIPKDRINGRPIADFINDFPFVETDKADLLALFKEDVDYLAGMSNAEKSAWLDTHSYAQFLREKVGLSEHVMLYFQRSTDDFMAVGIDATCCTDARLCALPGFAGMHLEPLDAESQAELDDPYTFHFPDGNASLTRLMVRKLIPAVAPGTSMHDVVLAKFDYSQLDKPEHNVRLRLNSTGLNARNITLDDGSSAVDVVYIHKQQLHRVRAKQVVMAGYNMMIPYLLPEVSQEQKNALRENVKAPLVYSSVVISNWQSFIKLGVHDIYCPAAPYCMVKLDFPVNMGGYKHPTSPDKPVVLHMVYVPNLAGSALSAREQSRKGRALLLGMSFAEHEEMIRQQLQDMLGSSGFNHQEDVLAITVNRWSHGYSYSVNTLFDDEEQAEQIIATARQPVGNISIANSDSDWSPYAHSAIEQGIRAVDELIAMQLGADV